MISSKKAYCLLGVGVFVSSQEPIFSRKCGGESGGEQVKG